MSGATVDTGTGNPIVPTPYPFNLGTTLIMWIATNISGADTCSQTIIVIDNTPPTFYTPDPIVFCVLDIFSALWDGLSEPWIDIIPEGWVPGEPRRPDWHIIAPGSDELDLDEDFFDDNCCDPEDPADVFTVYWRIDFEDGTSIPAAPGTYITGQPSVYGDYIVLPGDGEDFEDVIHTITYRLEDCNGNLSDPSLPVNIIIKPRPNVIKQY